jgi:starch-binding outer membrane protein SusE/F
MKQYLFSFMLITLAFAQLQCKKDKREIDLKLTPVESLTLPSDNKYIKLDPAGGATETFQWGQSRAEDGALVLYEVAFDQVGGDFSKPFFSIVSDDRGVENKLTLTHGQLNQIAAVGGADFFQRKKFAWTVLASKGTNVVKASESRTIDLERPAGFATIPGSLYIYGSGTEAGNILANALQMHKVAPGIFEIFTKLSAGTYKFVDGVSGTPKQFSIVTNGSVNSLVNNGETTVTTPDKIERITVNFNDVNAKFVEIKKMEFWYAQANDVWFELPYVANGLWRKDNWPTTLLSVPWGLEDRYKYRMTINDGTGDKFYWINSTFNDPPGQDNQYPSTVAYRTVNLDKNDGSQFDWGWKLDKAYVTQGSVVTYWISLRGSDPVYTQNYSK